MSVTGSPVFGIPLTSQSEGEKCFTNCSDLEKTKQGSKNEILELFDRIKRELEEQKKEHERLSEMLDKENEKRIREAEVIRCRSYKKVENALNCHLFTQL